MLRRTFKYGSYLLVGIVLCVACLYIALNIAVSWPEVRDPLLRSLDTVIGYQVEARELSFALWPRPHLRADGVVLRKKDTAQVISLKRLSARFDPRKLVRLEIVPTEIQLVEPVLDVSGLCGAHTDQASGRTMGGWPQGLKSLLIVNGTIRFPDCGGEARELNAAILPAREDSALPLNISVSAAVMYKQEKIPVRFLGKVDPGTEPKPLSDWDVNGHFTIQDAPLKLVPPISALRNISGLVSIDVKARGSWRGGFKAKGALRFEDLKLRYIRSHGEKDYEFKFLTIEFDGAKRGRIWEDPNIRMKSKDLDLGVDLKLDFSGPEFVLDVSGAAAEMPLPSFLKYFPSPNLPSWVTERILERGQSGLVKVDLLRLHGTLQQIDKAGEPENGSVVTCDIAFRDISATLSKNAWPIRNFAAVATYRDGTLDIHDIAFLFGKSKTKNLRIEVENVASHDRTMNISVEGNYLLEDLVRQTRFEEVPRIVKSLADSFSVLTGNVSVDLNAQKQWNRKGPALLWGKAQGQNVSLDREGLRGSVSLEEGVATFTRQGHALLDARGVWNGMEFTVRSDSSLWLDPVENYEASFDSRIDVKRMADIIGLKLPEAAVISGQAPLALKVVHDRGNYSFQGKAGLKGLKIASSVADINFNGDEDRAEFKIAYSSREGLTVNALRVDLAASAFSASGSWRNDAYKLDLVVDRLEPCDLGGALCSLLKERGGFFSGELFVSKAAKEKAPSFNGYVRGADLSTPEGLLASPIHNANFLARFSDADFILDNLDLTFGSSDAHIQGSFKDWKNPRGKFNIKAPYLAIGDMIAWENKESSGKENRIYKALRGREVVIDIAAKVDEGRFRSFEFQDLRLNGLLTNDVFSTQYLSFSSGSGVCDGEISIPFTAEKTPHYSMRAEFKNQSFQDFARSLGEDTEKLTGLLDLQAELKTRGGDKQELLKNLQGQATLKAHDGTIKKSNILLKIFALLNMQKMLVGKFPDFRTRFMDFGAISATFHIENGVAETDDFRIDGADARFAGTGKINFAEGTIDATIGVAPLVTLDAIVSKIPLAGYILTGKNKSLLTFYFAATGPLQDPDVSMEPLQSLTHTVLGILVRTFTAPAHVIDEDLVPEPNLNMKADPAARRQEGDENP